MNKRTEQPGNLTISKTYGSKDVVSVTIKIEGAAIKAEVSLTEFSKILFGQSDHPCNVIVRKGKYNGSNSKSSA